MNDVILQLEHELRDFSYNPNGPDEVNGISRVSNLSEIEKWFDDHNSQCFSNQTYGSLTAFLSQDRDRVVGWNNNAEIVRNWVPVFFENRLLKCPDSYRGMMRAFIMQNIMGLYFELLYRDFLDDQFYYTSIVLPVLKNNTCIIGWKKKLKRDQFLKRIRSGRDVHLQLDMSSLNKEYLVVA